MSFVRNANTNTNNNKFLNKDNINLLWDVLLDELHMQNESAPSSIVKGIRSVFETNINPFITRAKPNSNIMELNKLFLAQIITAVNRLFPNLKQIRTINISDEVIEKEPYKVEDIQASRQSEFERQMQQKQEEFESIASFKKPAELDFSDKQNEGKITEMQALIAETIAKRNFEVEQFQNANANSNPNFQSESETWLQSTNTSLKSEKVNANKTALSASEYRKPNYKEPNKRVTWDEENINTNINNNNNNMELVIEETQPITNTIPNTNNIFNKLKKIPVVNVNANVNANANEDLSLQIAALNTKFDTMINLMTNLITTIQNKE